MKTIEVKYFALLREQRGLQSESLNTMAHTAKELYEELKTNYGFSLSINQLKIAKNNQFVTWDSSIESGDSVVFIPPVAGG